MNEEKKEQEEGIDWDYLARAMQEKQHVGNEHITPLAGHLGQLFAVTAKSIIDRLGLEEGEALIKEIVERFAEERGRRIAEKVKRLNKPLTLKNFIIYSDLDSAAVVSGATPSIENGDLILEIADCNICKGADDWGLKEYAYYYCKYIDVAILRGYNPKLKLDVSKRLTARDDCCVFRYTVKEPE